MARKLAIQAGRSKVRARGTGPLSNGQIALLLAQEAENATGHMVQALRRAARSAFLWPEEVADILGAGRRLTELNSIGPHLARLIGGWVEAPPAVPEPNELQREFLTMSEARRILAAKPQWRGRLKGDLQMHTTWSDGSGSVKDMAAAGLTLGYAYIGITDHTQGLKIAGGLTEAELAAQGREIAAVNRDLKKQGAALRVLRSTEVNLSPAGEVDMEPKALAELDIVLGSFHSSLRKKEDQTARYVAALRNPNIQTLGHPQGRVYNYRSGLHADWPRVFAEAAKLDKAVEIDGYADRQDLKGSLLKMAKKEGCRISLGTDAHHPWQLAYIDLSLAAACRAGIAADRILNFMPAEELLVWVSSVRERATNPTRRAR
ncbi:MAG TPA: hypothetical protein VD994_07745 [Prosthecobacter sp.]|nr:hypothetical protein [Prosthecobacter sp.]